MRNHCLLQPFIVVVTLALLTGSIIVINRSTGTPVVRNEARGAFAQLPLSFEASGDSQFIARGAGYSVGLRPDEATLRLRESTTLRMRMLNANQASQGEGLEPLQGKVNYFIGADPRAWRVGAPTYAKVRYRSVYPGVDLVYYGAQRRVEYDFIVAPGADPRAIELGFEGVDALRIDDNGDLILSAGDGEMRQHKPVIYQEVDGARRSVDGSYAIRNPQSAICNRTVSFQIGDYDASRPLVIDPVLAYSTYFGSSGAEDFPGAIAVDAAGQIYLVGTTGASDFPTANPGQGNLKGRSDVFISKLNAAGNALVYSTYLGGANEGQGADLGFGVAVDSTGNAYVTGMTSSSDFPTVAAFQSALRGPADVFVTKFNPSGVVVFSTYLGGSGVEFGFGIAVDSVNAPYIVGTTSSTDLLSGGAKKFTDDEGASSLMASPEQTGLRGPSDTFVIKLAPAGSARVYGRYLGGSGPELGLAIAVDASGAAYVTGLTSSNDFPTANPLQADYGGGETDGFVAKIAVNGGSLVYSTYLGGGGLENHTFLQRIPFPGAAIAVDGSGNAYVAGTTTSSNFPTRNAARGALGGAADAYLAKLNAAGSALVYSTFVGGSGEELGFGLAVDGSGAAYVAGATASTDFPMQNPLRSTLNGQTDAFVTKLSAGGAFTYSTYLGGSDNELASSVAVDSAGAAYVFGLTGSGDYPTVQPLQSSRGGDADTFISKLRDDSAPAIGSITAVSAATYLGPQLAPESIVAAFGKGFSTSVEAATSTPLPMKLAGAMVTVRDSLGVERPAPLFFVAPNQINFQMPADAPTGQATIIVTSGAGQVSRGEAQIAWTAAGLFSADASGQGLAAAVVLRVRANGQQVYEPVAHFDQSLNRFVAAPIDFGPSGDQLFLILFGTGFRYRASAAASLGGTSVNMLYAGPGPFVGLDQCNVNLPRSLAGRGEVNVALTIDGRAANTVRVSFK